MRRGISRNIINPYSPWYSPYYGGYGYNYDINNGYYNETLMATLILITTTAMMEQVHYYDPRGR